MSLPYARLSTFYFIYFAAVGAFVPYWSLFLDARGLDAVAIGAVMSLWYGTRMFSPSLWSFLVARDRDPARWLRIGAVATAISAAFFLLPLGAWQLAGVMLAFCAFFNAIMPQFESITLSHLVGATERYGAIRVWGSIGFIVTVTGIGFVFERWSALTLPWLLLPMFIGLAVSSYYNDYGRTQPDAEGQFPFKALVLRREVLAFLLVAFLMQIAFGPYNTFFSLYLKENDYRPAMLGAFWALGVLVEIAVFALAAQLLRRIPARRMMVLALVLAALRWTVTALAPRSVVLMSFAQISHAIIFGGFYAACMQLISEYFPGRAAGHGQGVFAGFSSGVGGVIGALGSGYAWKVGGGKLAFLLAAGAAALAAWIALREFGRTTPRA
jgi:PPP family 3-phenylpropionic acid transporter